jgi:HEAT repeat protein
MKTLLSLLAAGLTFAASAFAANDQQAISDLIPRLADPVVGNRYAAEMELQALAADASKPGNEAQRLAFGTALAAKAADASVPQPARVWIVRQLQYMGGAEAVDALTQLLNGADVQLREDARRALEKNSAPAASAILRAALAKGGDAAWIVGCINSLGERRDTAAVSLIAKRLVVQQSADVPTATAAAWALGRIASPDAVAALWQMFPAVPPIGDALICAADRLATTGDKPAANAIFQKLYAQAKAVPLRAAALSGAAKTDPAAARSLIAEALKGSDPRLQDAAIAAAAGSPEMVKLVNSLLSTLGPVAATKALAVVDAEVLPAVIKLTANADSRMRAAAIEALGRIGTADSAMALIKVVTTGEPADKASAELALVVAPGGDALASLEKSAAGSETAVKVAALNALSARQQKSALPLFLAAASSPDAAQRKAGISGLRQMGGDAEIEAVAKLALAKQSEDLNVALSAMAERAADKAATADKLLALAGGKEDALAALAPALAALGSDKALAVFAKLAASQNAGVRESAIEALGNWPTIVAAVPLLDLATPAKNPNGPSRSAAFAALVNLVKNLETASLDQRLVTAQAALNLASSPAETKLALSALASVPAAKSGAAVKPLLTDPAVKQEAASAALTIAEALAKTDRKTCKDLAEAVKAANVSPNLNKRAERLLGR